MAQDFDIRNRRAMVSLGPLSPKRFCTYACAFCYVHAHFKQYPSLTNLEILSYLRERRSEFDIVYVSGDTDSFAPPRATRGIELLEALGELECDVLFTTRALFDAENMQRLRLLQKVFDHTGRVLVACMSISRLRSAPHIEPSPIPTPESRIEQLRCFKQNGMTTVLAMRPFLPILPPDEYVELTARCRPHVDVVLGEAWYADKTGVLEAQVFQGAIPPNLPYSEHEMDFDSNGRLWKIWDAKEIQDKVSSYCSAVGLPFYMRSGPAITYLRTLTRLM